MRRFKVIDITKEERDKTFVLADLILFLDFTDEEFDALADLAVGQEAKAGSYRVVRVE